MGTPHEQAPRQDPATEIEATAAQLTHQILTISKEILGENEEQWHDTGEARLRFSKTVGVQFDPGAEMGIQQHVIHTIRGVSQTHTAVSYAIYRDSALMQTTKDVMMFSRPSRHMLDDSRALPVTEATTDELRGLLNALQEPSQVASQE